MATFAPHVIDKFVAPGASAFTSAEIPDMSTYAKESGHWVANFFLNSVFGPTWKPPYNAYMYNYLRRAEAAFSSHAAAREATLAFTTGGSQSSKRYASALFHWECFLGQSWHGFKTLEKSLGVVIYKKGEGAVEERLDHLYNQMKHVESRIENGQLPSGANVPVWLSNSGLQSVDAEMTYAETAEILKDVAKWADILQHPNSAPEKLADA